MSSSLVSVRKFPQKQTRLIFLNFQEQPFSKGDFCWYPLFLKQLQLLRIDMHYLFFSRAIISPRDQGKVGRLSYIPHHHSCPFRIIDTPRSNHRLCSIKRIVLKNFLRFTGKYLGFSLSFNKVGGLRSATLFKKRLLHSCFPVNFAKFFRTPFIQNNSWQLLQYASQLLSIKQLLVPGAQQVVRGEGGRPPLLFFENPKKCPGFGKKCPNCVHPQVKFVIQNVVLRVSKRKLQNFSLRRLFFLTF